MAGETISGTMIALPKGTGDERAKNDAVLDGLKAIAGAKKFAKVLAALEKVKKPVEEYENVKAAKDKLDKAKEIRDALDKVKEAFDKGE